MRDNTNIANSYYKLVESIGMSAVSTLYPNDFEYYLCAFELVQFSENRVNTVEYFMFPIQPSSIQKTEPRRVNIKTSMSSINVLKNSSPVPQEIVLKGNFGRNFKIMSMQGVAFSGSGVYESTNQRSGALSLNSAEFSTGIKTGFGAMKLLQRILKRSNELTSYGESLQLFFYNLAFGESYLVTIPPSGVTFSQTQDQNMIWQYSVNLTILAPLSEVLFQNQMNSKSMNLVGRNAVQSSLNVVAKNVTRMIMGK